MKKRRDLIGMQRADMQMIAPENHLLRRTGRMAGFKFIYEQLAPYYPSRAHLSAGPGQYVQNTAGRGFIGDQVRTQAGRESADGSCASLVS